jgi:hypothetical protein
MRTILLSLLCSSLALTQPNQTQPTSPDTGKVRMIQGKYVFFHNQPVAPYDVAFSFASIYTPSEQMNINTIISSAMTAALTEAGAQLKPFDGIIIQPGARDIAIKFKDTVSQTDKPLATVLRQGGVYLFEYCDPIKDYKVLKTEKVAWYNFMFGGAFYTLAQVEANLVKSAQKKSETQAVIFNETASYVSYKD